MAGPNNLFENVDTAQLEILKKMRRVEKHTPNAKTKEQQKKICELRMQGYNFAQIAQQLGIRPQHAHEQHRRAMKAIIQEPAQEVRDLEVTRLDMMLASLHADYNKFFPVDNSGQVIRDVVEDEDGNPVLREDGRAVTYKLEDIGPRMQILDRMLKIQDRRAKLLGLDAPVRRTLEGVDGGPVKFDHNTLRGLSDSELTQMVLLMEKATSSDAPAPTEGS